MANIYTNILYKTTLLEREKAIEKVEKMLGIYTYKSERERTIEEMEIMLDIYPFKSEKLEHKSSIQSNLVEKPRQPDIKPRQPDIKPRQPDIEPRQPVIEPRQPVIKPRQPDTTVQRQIVTQIGTIIPKSNIAVRPKPSIYESDSEDYDSDIN